MFIYAITNDLNDKVYIGLHSGRDLRTRWVTHKSFSKRGSRSLISLAIRKHGIDKFHMTSLWSGHVSFLNLKNLEKYFIRSLGSRHPNGYNMTDGGDGVLGFRHSDIERQQRSDRMRAQIHSGNIPSQKGAKRSAEIGRKISLAKTGKKREPFTEEAKRNMSKARIGNKNGLGYSYTPEQIAKRTATRRARPTWNRRAENR